MEYEAQQDVLMAAQLEATIDYLIKRNLLTASYVKAGRSLSFYTTRVAKARLADEMMDARKESA